MNHSANLRQDKPACCKTADHPSDGAAANGRASERPEAEQTCFHCQQPLPKYSAITVNVGGVQQPVCCHGCQAAAEFISGRGLADFYRHRQRSSDRDQYAQVAREDRATGSEPENSATRWHFLDSDGRDIDRLGNDLTSSSFVRRLPDGTREFAVSVQGMYCSSCSWLIDSALHTLTNDISVQVDIDARRLHLKLADNKIKVSDTFNIISELGYKPEPVSLLDDRAEAGQADGAERRTYLKRLAVAGLGMMQVMTYAVASYLGEYQGIDDNLHRFLTLVSMLVATLVVFYSGRLFFENAWNDLKNKHLGMDVPIALAIGGAYFPSVYLTLSQTAGHVYFDSAVMFVFFLLLGRYVEMRARHRLSTVPGALMEMLPHSVAILRAGTGTDVGQQLTISPTEVKPGDQITLTEADSVPFDGVIVSGQASFDESLISGESEPQLKHSGMHLVAGSRLIKGLIELQATTDWAHSSITKIEQMLRGGRLVRNAMHDKVALLGRYFVAVVLTLTVAVAVFWWVNNPQRMFDVTLAMLIAACPCAFSLAFPVGVTAASNALRRVGILLANSSILEAIDSMTHWCFDKTGTLTEGSSEIVMVQTFGNSGEAECLAIAAAMEGNSEHALANAFRRIDTGGKVSQFEELAGRGLTAVVDGQRYWLGKRQWVMGSTLR